MNTARDIEESRPWWKTRLIAIGLTVGLALFILVSFALVIAGPTFGERVADMLRLGPMFVWVWTILQWPIVFALVVTAIPIIYYYAPDAEQDWVWITPGAVLATLLWLTISLGFKVYLANWGNYNEIRRRGARGLGLKPSDFLIGAAALLPPAIAFARTLGRARRRA